MDKNNVLAIDIGGSKLMAGIVDSSGVVLCSYKTLLNKNMTGIDIIRSIMDLVTLIKNQHPELVFSFVGVTIPGLADPVNGIWIYACFSQIKDLQIAEMLSKQLNVPVYIDNDVNACALGEQMYGCCKNVNDFIWMTVSNGIGGALVLGGKLYYGAFLNAGEIGHFNVEENGYLCGCGNKGCLEAMAAGPGIVKRYIAAIESNASEYEHSHKTDKKGVDFAITSQDATSQDTSAQEITAQNIALWALQGNRLALEVYAKTGYYIGKALSYAVNLLNCDKIILGGGVSQAMELFLPELKSTMNRMLFGDANKNITIERTALGYNAGLIGAAALARRGRR